MKHCREKFQHVKLETINCINEFLNCEVPNDQPNPVKLRSRVQHLNNYLTSLPKNISIRVC